MFVFVCKVYVCFRVCIVFALHVTCVCRRAFVFELVGYLCLLFFPNCCLCLCILHCICVCCVAAHLHLFDVRVLHLHLSCLFVCVVPSFTYLSCRLIAFVVVNLSLSFDFFNF